MTITTLYNQRTPAIENGKLVLVSKNGSRSFIGITQARNSLKELECKSALRESTIAHRNLLRDAVSMWDARKTNRWTNYLTEQEILEYEALLGLRDQICSAMKKLRGRGSKRKQRA